MINECNPRTAEKRADKAGVYPDPHLCAVSLSIILKDDSSMQAHFEDWLNYCQRHVCQPDSYCNNGKGGCKYGFEKSMVGKTKLTFKELPGGKFCAELHHKRDDGFLNGCNSMQGQHWQANVDMKLLIDFQRAKTYAVKYVTKAEPTSRDTAQLFQSIMCHATDASWTSTQLRKVFLQMSQVNYIGKGQAAQMLAGGNLYSSTYQFVTVNCDLSIVKLVKDVVSGIMVLGPDIKTFFANRSDHGIHLLFDFGRRFEVKPGKLKQILDPTKIVVKLVPKFSSAVLGKNFA
ncbi:hypothetical protein HDU99_008618, partial [Rhizoclosmatium hyalinum]